MSNEPNNLTRDMSLPDTTLRDMGSSHDMPDMGEPADMGAPDMPVVDMPSTQDFWLGPQRAGRP